MILAAIGILLGFVWILIGGMEFWFAPMLLCLIGLACDIAWRIDQ